MPTRTLIAAITLTVLSPNVWAQLVSVRCCTEQPDLERIGECISGPGDTSQPTSCPPAATCVLGFGDNAGLMESLCDPAQVIPPIPFRAYCSEWVDETSTIVNQCVAKSNASINLFAVYDDDQDGDLDLQDLAVFDQVYDSVPKLVQSDAVLVAVECCVPDSVIRSIGDCLSGPGGTTIPGACDGTATCVVGFSELVELGDWQYKLCANGPAALPDPSTSFCDSWQMEGIQIIHSCRGSRTAGNSFFVVSDSDGDDDVDLADFSVFQREFGPEMAP